MIIGIAVSSLTTRFKTLSNIENSIMFFYKFIDIKPNEIKQNCFDLQNKFKDDES